MLTPRGFWFLLAVFSVLIAAITLAATTLTLVCLTLLAWFLAQWFVFQSRVRLSARRLSVERVLRTKRGAVESIWAKQKVEVALRVVSDAAVNLPYVIVSERIPALATVQDGAVHLDGTLGKASPLEWTYSLVCASPGRLRFEGVKVEVADPQGFFTFATFVRAPKEYRVLPAMVVESTQTPFVKQHNTLPLLGSHRHARPGGSSELLDLRDYQPGDPPKLIAWKISARRDRLITKEFESEVPIRCTIFLDTSNSVRIGPVGSTALCRLIEIAAGVAQSNASERDLTGLCIFDETGVRDQIRPGRGSKHMMQMLERLTHVAGLIPRKKRATVRELLPYAYGLLQDVYPEYLDGDVNYFPWWLPWWSPQPRWAIPRWAPRYWSRLSGGLHREQRWRKEVSAILAVRYDLGPGGMTMLMEDDVQCAKNVQRFLAEHQVACPFALYDADGANAFAAPEKTEVLADALLKAVTHGKDNELFVLCVDLFDCEETMAALEGAICVARARHHQVIVVAPWPIGVPAPTRESTKTPLAFETLDAQTLLQQIFTDRLHTAFTKVQRALGKLGVPVLCAAERDSVHWILHRMRRLRIQEGRAMTESTEPRKITMRHYQALCGLALATVFLLQLQQSAALVFNLFMLLVGALCILLRLRFSPLLVFLTFAAGQAFEQYNQSRFAASSRFQFLNLNDVMLCIAMLTYLIAQYRLNGLRFGVLIDARAGAIPVRSEDSLSPAELVELIFPVPLWALAGQVAMLLLARQWGPMAMNPIWRQLFLATWTLLLGVFLAAHIFRYWRRMQMTRAMALMMLQDILWHEIGGEQRRIERWNAWRKLNP